MSRDPDNSCPRKIGETLDAKATLRAWKKNGSIIHVEAEGLEERLSEIARLPRSWQLKPAPLPVQPKDPCDPDPPTGPVVHKGCLEAVPSRWWQRLLYLLRLRLPGAGPCETLGPFDAKATVYEWDQNGVVQVISPDLAKAIEKAKEWPDPVKDICLRWSPRFPVEGGYAGFGVRCDPVPPVSGKCCEGD